MPLFLILALFSAPLPLDASPPPVVHEGTVKRGGEPLFSFRVVEAGTSSGLVRTAELCWPRRREFRAIMTVRKGSFDLEFCPSASDPTRIRPDDCVVLRRIPTATTLGNSELAVSALERAGQKFEFYLRDATSTTVRSWLEDEWRQVDPSMRFALGEWLSLATRADLAMGDDFRLLLAVIPPSEVRLVERSSVSFDTTPSLCTSKE